MDEVSEWDDIMSGGCDGVYSVSRRDSGQRAKDSKNR